MTDAPAPRLYLVTPAQPDLTAFPGVLAGLLTRFDIACVRLASAGLDEQALVRTADALRPACHDADVPLVMEAHFRLAARLGLDGVHLTDGPRQVRAARETLGSDSIVGAFAGTSRHDGMIAAEIGADYVSFGPVTPSALGDGSTAPLDLFAWWSEMIEIPVVAEGGIALEQASALARLADFITLGDEIWTAPDGPEAALAAVAETLRM